MEKAIVQSAGAVEHEYGIKYGLNAIYADMEYIDSDEYADKFSGITDNIIVNKTLLSCSRAAIAHRNGTQYEDMYIIDAVTGAILGEQTDCTIKDGIEYNDSINNALKKAKKENIPIIAYHNHPLGVPPSADDFNKAYDNNYFLGVVGGHNGQIYVYYKPYEKVLDPDLLHDDIIYDIDILGVDIDRAHKYYFNKYGLSYKIMKGADTDEKA